VLKATELDTYNPSKLDLKLVGRVTCLLIHVLTHYPEHVVANQTDVPFRVADNDDAPLDLVMVIPVLCFLPRSASRELLVFIHLAAAITRDIKHTVELAMRMLSLELYR